MKLFNKFGKYLSNRVKLQQENERLSQDLQNWQTAAKQWSEECHKIHAEYQSTQKELMWWKEKALNTMNLHKERNG